MSLLGYTINCLHQAAPTIVKGQITVPGAQTSFPINGTIQPSSPAQLSTLSETRRLRGGIYTVFTFDTLLTIDDNVNSDIVIYNSLNYEVVSKVKWSNNLINHNVYLIQEIRSR